MTKRPPKPRRVIQFRIQRLVDPDTGVMVWALVPASDIDRTMLRDRGFKPGEILNAEPKKARNPRIHRLVHGLGQLAVEQLPGFQNEDAHSALKRLQEDAEVECDVMYHHLPGVGHLKTVRARSMAFDKMDQAEFDRFWSAISDHICQRYWPDATEDTIARMIQVMPKARAG